jgi:hypothetical protein
MLARTPFENVVDNWSVADTFCTDLVKVEKLGPCARLTFAVRQSGSDGRGGTQLEYQVVAKLVVPCEMLVTMGGTLAQRPDLTPEAKASEPGRELH